MLDRARIAPYNGIQGRSLMPLVDGAPDDPDADVVIEDDQQRTILGFDSPPRVRTLVTRRWRMTLYDRTSTGASSTTSRTTPPSWSICGTTPPPASAGRAECMERLARRQMELVDRSPLPTNRA